MKQLTKQSPMLKISLCCITFIIIFYECGDNNGLAIIRKYFPELAQNSLSDISAKEISDNIEYLTPYVVYIKFKANATIEKGILDSFARKGKLNDTSYFKYTPIEQKFFFSIKSICASRNSNLMIHEKWWDIGILNNKTPVYVYLYQDNSTTKRLTQKDNEANGRVALCFNQGYCYMLIECWG